jgi:hypothetical protein
MKPLDLYSEPYSASGNLTSVGILNQLGRPSLDIFDVLVREAVQNSWDARMSDALPVRFGIAGWSLSHEHLETLRRIVFLKSPSGLSLNSDLLADIKFNVLALYDRGTTGLGGPTRADVLPVEAEPSSFADFVRNVGQPQPPVRNFSGGTYGYGKAAFYRISEVHTICVHTRCLSREKPQSRFIAAALTPSYSEGGYRYTGRHWWGRCESGIAEPLLDDEADELAHHLGLPEHLDGERGTTILVLQPIWGERTPIEAMNLMAESLLWNCWPKILVNESGSPSMIFEMSWEGSPINIPEPNEFPPLQGFVQAMQYLKEKKNTAKTPLGRIISIDAVHPQKHLGFLSLRRFPALKRAALMTGTEKTSPIEDACHHVALMRRAELVVKYLAGPPLPLDYVEYAGVFITDEGVDAIFADAEPPAHDNWVYEFLAAQSHRTFVRTALRRIKEAAEEFVRPSSTQIEGAETTSLGAFANEMGSLLPGEGGPGATFMPLAGSPQNGGVVPRPSSRGISGGRVGLGQRRASGRARVTLINDGKLIMSNGAPALCIEFLVGHAHDSYGTLITVQTGALLDDNEMEVDPPIGSSGPKVLEWIDPDGNRQPGSQETLIPASVQGTFQVIVSIPDQVLVGVDFTATARFDA